MSLLLLGAAPLAAAQPLDLAAAMARGRAGAHEVAAAGARETAAAERARQARAHRFPVLRAQEIWNRTDSPAEAFALLLNQERFSFPAFVGGDPNDPQPLETAITRLEVEVPIWTGGEISTRGRQAALAADAAKQTALATGDRAALAAAEAWVRLAQAREFVALLDKSRATVAAHVDRARAYAEQGMLVRSEVLRAEVERARLDDLVAEARGRARLAQSNLAFRLGEPRASEYELAALAEPPPLAGARQEWIEAAAGRRDLAAAQALLAAGELEARALQARLLPRLGLVARHDLVDDSLFGSHGDGTTVMAVASFEFNLGGERRSAIAAARAEAEAGRQDVARFAEGARLEAEQAYEEASVALERRATARQAIAAAAEALRITEERFGSGVARTIDLLDAATARREAETRELVARADAHLALLRLAVAAGRAPESALAPTVAAGAEALAPIPSPFEKEKS